MKLVTGFGERGTQDFVYFTHLTSETGRVPDWHANLRYVEDPIVGSNNTEIQILGYDAAKMEARLKFHSRDDYYRLQAKVGQKGTLVLVAYLTRFQGQTFHWRGRDYEAFDDVLLLNLVPQMRTGATLATATFVRASSGIGGVL